MSPSIIGIDIGGTNIRCAVVSKKRKVLEYKKEAIADKNSKEAICKQLNSLIDRLFSSDIKGIGVGVPAIVNLSKGTLYEAYNLKGWSEVPLGKMLKKRYNVPVIINNDANCFALGEKYFGHGRKYKNIAGIIVGTGFGVGIIIEGKLYCGNNCAAGEFGRISLKDKTIEDYCSGKFFIEKYKMSGKKMHEMAKKKNKTGINAFREFGINLGLGVSAVINAVDPEIVILGGSVSRAYNLFKETFLASLKQHTYKHVYKNIKVKASANEKTGVLGAASLFFT